MNTFAAVLTERLRSEPGRPLVTYYDDDTGERTELSVTTYANWVAKASSLLVDELGHERGETIRLDLPTHWLSTVVLGAAWSTGLVVVGDADPDVVVCGPDALATWAPDAGRRTVLATALAPMGGRFAEPLPDGVHDLGVEIWSQPDAFTSYDPPTADDDAYRLGTETATQAQTWEAAAAGTLVTDGGRLLVEVDPASPPGAASFCEPLRRGGSLVLVARAGRDRVEAIAAAEHVTARFPTRTTRHP